MPRDFRCFFRLYSAFLLFGKKEFTVFPFEFTYTGEGRGGAGKKSSNEKNACDVSVYLCMYTFRQLMVFLYV